MALHEMLVEKNQKNVCYLSVGTQQVGVQTRDFDGPPLQTAT